MIEDSICIYLLNNSNVITELGNNHIFFDRAPVKVKTPWIVVDTRQGGVRGRISRKYVEPKQTLSIVIETDDAVTSRQIGEAVRKALDFYRGDMYGTRDIYLRCGTPYMSDGMLDVLQCIVPVSISFLEEITYPVPIG
jgi:hypothetical protein